jgi:hypothetical protein
LTLQEQLDDARAKYHLVVTGQNARVYVDQSGERIEYSVTNSARLALYIRDLERRLGVPSTTGPGVVWL